MRHGGGGAHFPDRRLPQILPTPSRELERRHPCETRHDGHRPGNNQPPNSGMPIQVSPIFHQQFQTQLLNAPISRQQGPLRQSKHQKPNGWPDQTSAAACARKAGLETTQAPKQEPSARYRGESQRSEQDHENRLLENPLASALTVDFHAIRIAKPEFKGQFVHRPIIRPISSRILQRSRAPHQSRVCSRPTHAPA